MTSAQYLQAAKIEEVASRLEAEGYRVVVGPSGQDDGYDLVAERGAEKLAIEVKDRASLKHFADEISRLRRRARNQGYDFRLVVVNPPAEVKVEVAGIREELRNHLIDELPHELDALSTNTRVKDVSEVEIDSIQVTTEGVRIKGNAVVEIELEYDGGEARDGLSWDTDFPFSFDVLLGRDLHIEQAYHIQVDTSSFAE